MKLAVCVLIAREDGRILAVTRRDDHTAWSLPGGKVEPGEDILAAVKRELHEETGCTCSRLSPVYSAATDSMYVTVTFLGVLTPGSVPTRQRGEGLVGWREWQDVVDGPFGAYNRKMLEALLSGH